MTSSPRTGGTGPTHAAMPDRVDHAPTRSPQGYPGPLRPWSPPGTTPPLHLFPVPSVEQEAAPPGAVARMRAHVRELLYKASREMSTVVIGARGEELTAADAEQRAHTLDTRIQMDEVRGSRRHRRVGRGAKISSLVFLGLVDFPIMLWLASSVFNVNWRDPLGLPLLISIVISVLGTIGAAAALYHLGHNLRDSKNHRNGLDWSAISTGSRLSLVGVVLLVTMIAVATFYRVYTEGINSGAGALALLLALLVAFVMLISAGLVFWTALRDGSPEQDDLAHYSKIAQRHRQIERQYELDAVELSNQCELLETKNE